MGEGWHSVGDKFVCAKCFDDEGLQEFISGNAVSKRCTYCRRFGRVELAAAMDEVLSYIAHCLGREYEKPEDSLGRDNESESGWALIDPTDTYDLFCDMGFGNGPDTLFQDLVDAFSDRQWVQADPYGSLPCDDWQYSWEEFSEQVKHRMRFVFFRAKTREEFEHEAEPHEILDSLERIVARLGLVVTLPQKSVVVRARQHRRTDVVVSVSEIGPPPRDSASQSRMSPAGIPMFYGAGENQTAFEEIFENDPALELVTFGKFEFLRPLRLLDLTNLPSVPSIFCNDEQYPTRMPLIFMCNFVEDVMKPIARDGRVHVDYVPTQVVCEFFRHLLGRESGERLDGIMYLSSKRKGGTCFTLFCESEDCIGAGAPPANPWITRQHLLKLTDLRTKTVGFSPPHFS
jgi:hypothetical protein